MKKRLLQQFEKDLVIERSQAKADIARQVRHNLRTPLAALMRIPSRLPDTVKSDRELLSSSIAQIRAITSALDENEISKEISANASKDIYDSITNSAREIALATPRRINFKYEIDDSIISAQTAHIPHEFRALLGNIVNNSIDAIGKNDGHISLNAKDMGPEVQIIIEDNGCGIQSKIINHIFENGFSSGKPSGTGIGLYHAKNWIESWGGRISATSIPPASTKIIIKLPIVERTSWYIPRLKFAPDDFIVVLDDQLSARHAWRMRMEEMGAFEHLHIIGTKAEVDRLLTKYTITPKKTHFLFDYEIGENVNGLDILQSLPINSHRYLVTGHFDQPDIRKSCSALGVYLLPKSELASIPIVVA